MIRNEIRGMDSRQIIHSLLDHSKTLALSVDDERENKIVVSQEGHNKTYVSRA